MRKEIIAFIMAVIVSLSVFSFPCFAQAELMPTYSPPQLDPSFPNPGDKSFVEQTVNGITVRITNLKKRLDDVVNFDTGETEKKWIVEIDVCHSIPDSGEWLLYGDVYMLKFKDVTSNRWGSESNLWNIRQPDGEALGEQCLRFKYKFDPRYRLDPPIEVTFKDMHSIPREWVSPCEDMMERVKTNVRAREAGLVVRCEEAPNAREDYLISPSDETLTLIDYDASILTKQEAYALMLEIESGVIYGPWVFKITPTDE